MFDQARGEVDQRPGEDVGQQQVYAQIRGQRVGQPGLQARGDAVACGVVVGREQRLRVEVDAPGRLGAEQQGGNGEDPRAAAVVEQRGGRRVTVEPFEAERRGRVGAGAERQARVEDQVHRLRFGRLAIARADPQAASETHRSEVVEPGAFPVAIGERLDAPAGHVAAE